MARRGGKGGKGRSTPAPSIENPLAGLGWSTPDFRNTIGTIVGEVAAKSKNIIDYQAIADVIANRMADRQFTSQYGRSATAQTRAKSQFSTWNPGKQTAAARRNAVGGFLMALNPEYERKLPNLAERTKMARQAVEDVFATGVGRGVAKGATSYHQPETTAKNRTDGWHNDLARRYGETQINDHTFTGRGHYGENTPYNSDYMTPGHVGEGYTPAPRDAYTVQPQGISRATFDQIYEGMPAYEAPATFDERYAPSGPMPPGSFGDFLGSYGNDHLIGSEQPASAGFFNDRFEGDQLPMNSAAFGRPIGDYEFGSQAAPMTGPASMAYGLDFETAPNPLAPSFFDGSPEQPTVSPTQFSNAYTAPMTGPASMAYGIDIGQPAPDPFAPEPAPDWFSDRLAEPSLYGPSFGLDTAMAGSRTSPAAPGRLGSEIAPEYTAHVPEASQQILDSFPDYDHLGAPPMGGYTPPAPPQDYTAPPSMLASMDIGGSTADRLRSPSGYGSDYMTPGYARDPMEGARDRLTAGLAERFGATASAAIPQSPPQAAPRAPDPVSRFTERTVYDTKMVPEKYTVDVPVERSFSKANVGPALGAKPTGFADLGFMSGLMTGNPWSDGLHQKAQNVTQPQAAPPQMRREERTRMVEQRTPRTIREVVKEMQPPTRPAMARPDVPSFTRPVSMQDLGINPIGAGGWGFNTFEPPAPSLSEAFGMAGNSLFGGLSDSILSGLGYGPGSTFTGGWGGPGSGPGGGGQAWGDGGPGGYGGGSVYDGNSGPYAGGDARFDGGWGGMSDSDTYR
jgi:hypothetical protein